MRIINRTVLTKETKDCVVTRVTERIVENDQYQLVPPAMRKHPLANANSIKVKCNICTEEFDATTGNDGRCPACGSIDVSLV